MSGGMFLPAKAALLSAAFLFLATGCATPGSFGGSRTAVVQWAAERGFVEDDIVAGDFRLLGLVRSTRSNNVLTIYIEGDGAPWATASHPPRNPTPHRPIALALAAKDPSPLVAYLGRPCQYLDDNALARCDSRYWIGSRYAPEIVSAFDAALDRLKAIHGVSHLRLVGHSGGGVLAALLAQRRQDVAGLITVAAPLALAEWTHLHGVTPLSASLDPAAQPGDLPFGVYWVGGRDRNVPPAIAASFARRKRGRMIAIADFDHECCWSEQWPALLLRSKEEEQHDD